MADMKLVQVVVVTPERAVLDETVPSVVLPMFDGELGVLPGRAPLTGRLGPGELRLPGDGPNRRYFVDGGFVQVSPSPAGHTVVTVLTPKAVAVETLTATAGADAVVEANAMPVTTPIEREIRFRAQERARGLARVTAKTKVGV